MLIVCDFFMPYIDGHLIVLTCRFLMRCLDVFSDGAKTYDIFWLVWSVLSFFLLHEDTC